MKYKNYILFIMFCTNMFFMENVYSQNYPVPFESVEIKPKYPGGFQALNNFISENYVIPDIEGISGVVKISFVVELNGTLSNFKIIQDLGEASAIEAKRVFLKLPFWEAGMQNGEKIRVLVVFPISVNL